MRIGGFQKQSLVDYPKKISSIIFLMGCNLRCPYCHNMESLVLSKAKSIPKDYVLSYLKENKGLIDAVTISGGEPTIYNDLVDFIIEIKKLGYLVKLDTNGTNPDLLNKLISEKLIDYIAMDIKSAIRIREYNLSIGNNLNKQLFDNIKKSIDIIRNSNIEYEFRTTIVKGIHTKDDILDIIDYVSDVNRYSIQNYSNEVVKSDLLTSFSIDTLEEIKKYANSRIKDVQIKNI